MIRFKILPILLYAILLACLSCITGCTDEYPDGANGDHPEKTVTLEVTVPAFDLLKTRALNGAKESEVQYLDFLMFDKSSPSKLIGHAYQYSNITQDMSEVSFYKITFTLTEAEVKDVGSIAVVANALTEVNEAIGNLTIGVSTKADVLAKLRVWSEKGYPANSYKWNTAGQDYRPIPMYGEIDFGAGARSTRLKRMLATIDVENEVNASIFKLQEIYLTNFKTTGFIAPPWNGQGVILNESDPTYPYSRNINPMIPPHSTIKGDTILYKYNQPENGVGPQLTGEIYTYEAPKTETDGNDNATCLIVKGRYLGKEYFYRIDFTTVVTDALGKTTTEYMPLYRNYKYIVMIKAVEGIGHSTFEGALKSTTVLSNLKTSLLVVDADGINDIVFDGQYFLGTDNKTADVLWYESKELNRVIRSDYAGSWTAKVTNGGTGNWLQFKGGSSQASGTFPKDTLLKLNINPLTSLRPAGKEEEGEILLSAGRLQMTLSFNRASIGTMFARSNVVYSGNRLVFAVTEADNVTYPSNMQGALFKWGSLVAFDPRGSIYNPNTHVIYNPTGVTPSTWGNKLAGWDKVPYSHGNFAFTPGNTTDPFNGYGDGGKGFIESKGIGDICRYISSKKWVEGNWRMPTLTDLEKLHSELSVKRSSGTFTDATNSITLGGGQTKLSSGWLMSSSAIGAYESIERPTSGNIFLPASGYRYPEGDGISTQPGIYGYYWSTTLYTADQLSAYTYWLRKGLEAKTIDVDRSYAFPVRCIRDN